MQRFLISYDISNNKIRGKVFRLLKKTAFPLQKSVFFFEGSLNELVKIEHRIAKLITTTDNVFVMPCCENCFNRAHIYTRENQTAIIA